MITREILASEILAYLNGQCSLNELVEWAEDAIVTFTESSQRPPESDTIWDILLYVGAGDTPDFPLTWDVIRDFLERLGRPIQTVVA
jgi:hypothetical protein